MTELLKQDLASLNIAENQLQKLKEIFPEAFTEGNKVDWDKLRLTLGESIDTGKERFGMNWPGKADCFKTIQQPSIATLVPDREESINFDTTENLFIEGDNLEVLKLLQKSYLGKVKMIYIDPPYNTGNDFIYPDNYSENINTYLEYTGQIDGEGRKFSTNTETDGRFHTKWMNMMLPRLFLAKNLLKDDGVIFISIDDNEANHLRALCDEIFGEDNFIADISVVNNLKGRNDKKYIATANERLMMYVKSYEFDECGLKLPDSRVDEFKEKDNVGSYRFLGLRKRGGADTRTLRPKMFFPIYINAENGTVSVSQTDIFTIEVFPRKSDNTDGCWRWGYSTVQLRINNLVGKPVGKDGKWDIFEKDYLETDGEIRRLKPKSIMFGTNYSTDGATKSFRALFPEADFNNPKSVPFLKDLIAYSSSPLNGDIILDFFAGSGSTAQATLEQNIEDNGNRKFICVQLPHIIEEESKAYIAGYKTIAEISKERIRRVVKKINNVGIEKLALEEAKKQATNQEVLAFAEPKSEYKILNIKQQNLGFKVFKLQKSNFKIWDANIAKEPEYIQQALFEHIDHISPEAAQEAILYELLLKSGFPLATPIETLILADKNVYSIADGELLICLEKELTNEVITAMAEKQPSRVICLDEGFQDNDQLKTNAVKIMASKGVVNFRTV